MFRRYVLHLRLLYATLVVLPLKNYRGGFALVLGSRSFWVSAKSLELGFLYALSLHDFTILCKSRSKNGYRLSISRNLCKKQTPNELLHLLSVVTCKPKRAVCQIDIHCKAYFLGV